MQPNFDNKSDAFINGFNDWVHCHYNNLEKPDNPYLELLLNGNRKDYDQWEEGWIEGMFSRD